MTTSYYIAPQGPWLPGPPASPPPRRRSWLIAVVAVVVLGIAGGATAFALYNQSKNTEPSKIKGLVNDFAQAVGEGNPQTIAGFMCAEEAGPFLDTVEDPGGEAAGATTPPFEIVDITVKADVASATLSFPGSETQTMYFRKENGKWTVCAPAKDQM